MRLDQNTNLLALVVVCPWPKETKIYDKSQLRIFYVLSHLFSFRGFLVHSFMLLWNLQVIFNWGLYFAETAFHHSDVLILSQECSQIKVYVIPGRLWDVNPFSCYILAGLLTLFWHL